MNQRPTNDPGNATALLFLIFMAVMALLMIRVVGLMSSCR